VQIRIAACMLQGRTRRSTRHFSFFRVFDEFFANGVSNRLSRGHNPDEQRLRWTLRHCQEIARRLEDLLRRRRHGGVHSGLSTSAHYLRETVRVQFSVQENHRVVQASVDQQHLQPGKVKILAIQAERQQKTMPIGRDDGGYHLLRDSDISEVAG